MRLGNAGERFCRRELRRMSVKVDRGELCPGDRMLGDDERRLRLVIANVRYGKLGLATRAGASTGSALSALALGPLRDGNRCGRDENEDGKEGSARHAEHFTRSVEHASLASPRESVAVSR